MDLGIVRRKLTDSEYSSVQEFIDDIQLICDNAKRFNGATSMYGFMGDDIMAAVNRRYSEKASSVEEEWYRSLVEAIRELEEHLSDPPAQIGHIKHGLKPPNFERTKLTTEQKDAIQATIGRERIENLAAKWPLLNEAARAQIMAIIEKQQPR
jgi:hypothetical protein